MPSIDVTDLFDDDDIADQQFSVIRRSETVNVHGEVETSTQRLIGYGAVQPTGDLSLVRQDAFDTEQQSIVVFTVLRLRSAGRSGQVSFKPDIVEWKGGQYLVRVVNDFTQFGAGYIEAECASIDHRQPVPT